MLADIGLFAIFFQVGLDFDLTAPELESVTPARSAAAGIVASFVLVFLFTLGLGNPAKSALLIAQLPILRSADSVLSGRDQSFYHPDVSEFEMSKSLSPN